MTGDVLASLRELIEQADRPERMELAGQFLTAALLAIQEVPETFVSPHEAARLLGVDESTIRRLARRKHCPWSRWISNRTLVIAEQALRREIAGLARPSLTKPRRKRAA